MHFIQEHEVFKKLGNMGMLGLTKPEAYGGAARLCRWTAAGSPSSGHLKASRCELSFSPMRWRHNQHRA